MEPAKRRILFLVTTADWGGAQRFVFDAAQACVRRGHTVLVAKGGHGELGERCAAAGIPSRTLDTVRREISPLHDIASLTEIRKLIREFKPDVVHLNSSKMGVVGSIACHLEHVPRTIYRIPGWAFLERVGAIKRMIYLWSERETAKYKDVIITVHPGDEAVARREKIRPRGNLVTIPNGIDLATFDRHQLPREEARRKIGIPADRFVIGTIANFYPPKNIPWYLEAIAKMTLENARFVIVGNSGPETETVHKKAVSLSLDDRVTIVNEPIDAATLLCAFDLFVLPSTKEGMPWTLLEAMAASLPCIATDVGACRWMLEPDAGVIIPANDAKTLAETIAELMQDAPRRNSMGVAARHAVETRFRWETTIAKTLELLEEKNTAL